MPSRGFEPDILGADLSPAMIEIARRGAPQPTFTVGSLVDLPVPDESWAGAPSRSTRSSTSASRSAPVAFGELARALRPGGQVLVAFHVEGPGHRPGEVSRLSDLPGATNELDGDLIDPGEVMAGFEAARLTVTARLEREPIADAGYPSRHPLPVDDTRLTMSRACVSVRRGERPAPGERTTRLAAMFDWHKHRRAPEGVRSADYFSSR